MEFGIRLLGDEGGGLALGPGGGEDGDDGDCVLQCRGRVAELLLFDEGLAVQVGEVEGSV